MGRRVRQKPSEEFVKYIVVSIGTSIVDLLIFQGYCEWMADTFMYIILATFIARIISCSLQYLGNYFWTFKSKRDIFESAGKFAIMAFAQMVLSAVSVSLICRWIQPSAELFVKIPVDIFLFFVCFLIQRNLIYK